LHPFRVVYRQPVGDAPATVMPADPESFNAQCIHDGHHVGGQRAFAVVAVVRQTGRFARIAVSTQIRHYQIEILRQLLGHPLPQHMGLWEAVQKQHRGPVSRQFHRHPGVDAHSVDLEIALLKTVKPWHGNLRKRAKP